MKLTEEQQNKVVENIGLVGKVISDKVYGINQLRLISYDDIYQSGCIGLCKAAAMDKGGCFSTFAYKLIWHEICDCLAKVSKPNKNEELVEYHCIATIQSQLIEREFEIKLMINQTEQKAHGSLRYGIDALKLFLYGYSSKDIAKIMKMKPGTVRMQITRAKRFLQQQQEIKLILEN